MKRVIAYCAALASFLMSASALAAPLYLGSISLSDRTDLDVLQLPRCSDSWNQRVTSLKLEIRNHPAQIDALQVQFQNGDVDMLKVREHFPVGGESRWIDLSGGERCIRFIRVIGDADTSGRTPDERARILFFGR